LDCNFLCGIGSIIWKNLILKFLCKFIMFQESFCILKTTRTLLWMNVVFFSLFFPYQMCNKLMLKIGKEFDFNNSRAKKRLFLWNYYLNVQCKFIVDIWFLIKFLQNHEFWKKKLNDLVIHFYVIKNINS